MAAAEGQSPAAPWYLGRTRSNQERLARFHLRNQGYEAYCPMVLATTRDRRLKSAKPFFPGYVFVMVRADQEVWPIFSTIGISSVICRGEQPEAIPSHWITDIREREVDGLVKIDARPEIELPCPHKPGDKVTARAAGVDFDAVFHEKLDANRVTILLSLLGREHRVVRHVSTLR